MTLEQRARALAGSLASTVTTIVMGDSFEMDMETAERMISDALKGVDREALERAANESPRLPYSWRFLNEDEKAKFMSGANCKKLAIRALIDTPVSEAPDARDAEIERGAIEMSLSDVYSLDDVVVALGIEDSDTTPAEAVEELTAEIKRLREVVRASADQTDTAWSLISEVIGELNWWRQMSDATTSEDRAIENKIVSQLMIRVREARAAREAARQTLDREPTKP